MCKIFRRINQAGKRLDRFDLISAMTFTSEFDLRERFKKDILDRLKDKLFGEISAAIVTQLLALVKHGLCTERYEYSLTADDIREYWKDAVTAHLLAADTLRKNMGVVNVHYLPYGAFVTLLAYYYMKSGNRGCRRSPGMGEAVVLASVVRTVLRLGGTDQDGTGQGSV